MPTVTNIEFDAIRLGNQFEVEVIGLDNDATLQAVVFVRMVVAVSSKCSPSEGKGDSSKQLNQLHWDSFQEKRLKGFGIGFVEQALGITTTEQPEHDRGQEGIQQCRTDQTRENHHCNRIQDFRTRPLGFKQ